MNTTSKHTVLATDTGSLALKLCLGGLVIAITLYFFNPLLAIILHAAAQLVAFVLGLCARTTPKGLAVAITSGSLLFIPLIMVLLPMLAQK